MEISNAEKTAFNKAGLVWSYEQLGLFMNLFTKSINTTSWKVLYKIFLYHGKKFVLSNETKCISVFVLLRANHLRH